MRIGVLRFLLRSAAGAGTVCGVAAILVSAATLKFLVVPFAWLGLGWAAALGTMALRTHRPRRKVVGVLLATLSGAVGAGEVGLGFRRAADVTATVEPRYLEPDSLLGWRLIPSHVARAIETRHDTVLYDVRYTVDSAGRRVSPPGPATAGGSCVLFFADSFVFGEGVADEETFPFRVGEAVGGRLSVANFGVPGYGAEHMLAIIESGRLAALPCRPRYVLYLALPHHVLRAVGHTPWSKIGPRFRFQDGHVVYRGTFLTPPRAQRWLARAWERARAQFAKSRLIAFAGERLEFHPSASDIRLYFAIVARIRDRLAQQYPTAEFHVIAWDMHPWFAGGAGFADSLLTITPHVHRIEAILPGYAADPDRYAIHAGEQHPNALAHDLIAKYVVEDILGLEYPVAPRDATHTARGWSPPR
jgi:hypothetical protein